MTENQDDFIDAIGCGLIESCSISIGNMTTTYKACKKCNNMFQCNKEDELMMENCRKMSNKQGNLTYCFDCDKNVEIHYPSD